MSMVEIRAEMLGTVVSVDCAMGARVEEGAQLLAIESMKMEFPVTAAATGTITRISVGVGDLVEENQVLVIIQR